MVLCTIKCIYPYEMFPGEDVTYLFILYDSVMVRICIICFKKIIRESVPYFFFNV